MSGLQASAVSDISKIGAQAQALADAGRPEEAIEAWRRALAAAPQDRRIQKALAGLLTGLGRYGEAVPHVRAMLEQTPDTPWLLRLLANALERSGDPDGAIEAWRNVARLEDWPPDACVALAPLLHAKGRIQEIEELASRRPEQIETRLSLARALADTGRRDDAIVALDGILNQWPAAIVAAEERDRLLHARRRGPAKARVIAFGSCQAIGIAQGLRRLLPDAEVESFVIRKATPAPQTDALLERCAAADLVLGQVFDFPGRRLGPERLRGLGDRFVACPFIVFTGLHPDVVYAPQDGKTRPFHSCHSRIIAAAYRLGLPRRRAAELFNGYVYAVLGYFDEFAKAERFLLASSRDLDLAGPFETWRGKVFVHVPKHPAIGVLYDMAQAACDKAGIATTAEASPGDDHQALRQVWPVYPEIARRLGMNGSMTFRPGRGLEPMELDDVIDAYYKLYETGASAAFTMEPVAAVADVLRAELA